MDLTQLRCFVAISRYRSFRQAAEAIHLAQPSLSQQIHRLEAELGVELFDRSRRPVRPTEAGQMLLARATQILSDVDDAVAELRDAQGRHRDRVVVGAMQYLAYLELPKLLSEFRQQHPRITMHLRIGNTEEIRGLLINGEIQLGLLHAETKPLPPWVEQCELRTEKLVLICARNDPLARRTSVDMRDLAKTPFIFFREGASIQEALIDAAATAGFTPRTTLESADMGTAVAFVEDGLGVALVPQSFAMRARERVGVVTVRSPLVERTVTLAWDNRRYRSTALSAMIDLTLKAFRAQRSPSLRSH